MFIPTKDKIDGGWTSLQSCFRIEDDGYLKKYPGIEFYCLSDGSIHLSRPYLTQRIINLIPGMEKSSSNPNYMVNPPLAKNEGAQPRKNDFDYSSVIRP